MINRETTTEIAKSIANRDKAAYGPRQSEKDQPQESGSTFGERVYAKLRGAEKTVGRVGTAIGVVAVLAAGAADYERGGPTSEVFGPAVEFITNGFEQPDPDPNEYKLPPYYTGELNTDQITVLEDQRPPIEDQDS